VHALVLLLPLLALFATCQVVNRAREDGTLEMLFGHPMRRGAWFAAVSAVRFAVLAVPLLVLMPALAVTGRVAFGQEIEWAFTARALGTSAALLAAFTGIGLLVSALVRNPGRATTYALLIWAAAVALLDFGLVALMLRWRLNPQVVLLLASLNPVQSARLSLVAGSGTDLSVLGPVGFYLATRTGPAALAALGTMWPAAAGLGAWALAARSFGRADAV